MRIEGAKLKKRIYEVELNQRKMKIYWDKHPDLTPVSIGDLVMITLEIVESLGGAKSAVGQKISIKKLTINDMQEVSVDLGTFARPSIEDVCSMRKAYLEVMAHKAH